MKSDVLPVQVRDLLIVDDDVSQVRLFTDLLAEIDACHRCHHAPNGREAIAFLQRERRYAAAPRPDLIILDINMPGADGVRDARDHQG